jgi:hypothetical protein
MRNGASLTGVGSVVEGERVELHWLCRWLGQGYQRGDHKQGSPLQQNGMRGRSMVESRHRGTLTIPTIALLLDTDRGFSRGQ